MLNKVSLGLAAGAAFLFAQTAAHAADVTPPKPAPKNNTLSLEFSPEWDASSKNQGLKDDYLKFGLSHSFDNNFVVGGSWQHTWRVGPPVYTGIKAYSTAEQVEASLGYKIKNGPFTLTPSVVLGYGFGDVPDINPALTPGSGSATDPELYYAASIAGDYKLSDNLTWNVFNARYRNAFSVTWITPKVSTGLTYKIDGSNSVYANVGYAWKDKGDGKGLQPDKLNLAVGYKLAF